MKHWKIWHAAVFFLLIFVLAIAPASSGFAAEAVTEAAGALEADEAEKEEIEEEKEEEKEAAPEEEKEVEKVEKEEKEAAEDGTEETVSGPAGEIADTETGDETGDETGRRTIRSKNGWDSLGLFRLTAYCPCEICNENYVGQPTSYGTELTPFRTIAVDRKVIPLGTKVKINLPKLGWTEFVAEDVGGAIRGNHIDICVSTHAETYGNAYNGTAEVMVQDRE